MDVHLDPIINRNKKTKINSKQSANDSTKELTLEDHRNKAGDETKELLDVIREKILKLGDDVSEAYTPEYIRYFVDTTFLAIHVRKKWLIGTLKINEKTFKDPKKITKDISSRKWSVTREFKIKSFQDIEYAMNLIKQAYDYQ